MRENLLPAAIIAHEPSLPPTGKLKSRANFCITKKRLFNHTVEQPLSYFFI